MLRFLVIRYREWAMLVEDEFVFQGHSKQLLKKVRGFLNVCFARRGPFRGLRALTPRERASARLC